MIQLKILSENRDNWQFKGESGLSVLVDIFGEKFIMNGCGHRGVCNTIEHAKRITGEDKIFGVFGGFHLRKLSKQKDKIDKTIEYLKQNSIRELYLGHCVTDEVIDYFEQSLKDVKIIKLAAGKEFELELQSLKEKEQ